MALEGSGVGDGGVVAEHVDGVPQRHPHLPPTLLAQFVQPGGVVGVITIVRMQSYIVYIYILVTKLLVWCLGSYCSHKKLYILLTLDD